MTQMAVVGRAKRRRAARDASRAAGGRSTTVTAGGASAPAESVNASTWAVLDAAGGESPAADAARGARARRCALAGRRRAGRGGLAAAADRDARIGGEWACVRAHLPGTAPRSSALPLLPPRCGPP
jgi:hypothetical protein